MMRRAIAMSGLPVLLAGCAGSVTPPPPAHLPPRTRAYSTEGLERVLGRDARDLERLFGAPDMTVTEGPGRKLQFSGPICVLDAYLYPPSGGGTPVVTYLDARQRDGSPIDRASCVSALTKRDGGK